MAQEISKDDYEWITEGRDNAPTYDKYLEKITCEGSGNCSDCNLFDCYYNETNEEN